MCEKLLDEILEYAAVSRSLEQAGKDNAILGIRRQDLISTLTTELCDLSRCYPKWGPACSSEADPLVASRLIHVDEVMRMEI